MKNLLILISIITLAVSCKKEKPQQELSRIELITSKEWVIKTYDDIIKRCSNDTIILNLTDSSNQNEHYRRMKFNTDGTGWQEIGMGGRFNIEWRLENNDEDLVIDYVYTSSVAELKGKIYTLNKDKFEFLLSDKDEYCVDSTAHYFERNYILSEY